MKHLLVGLAFLAGCVFPPDLGNGMVQCASDGSCPPGLHCGGDRRCYQAGNGSTAGDMTGGGPCLPRHCFIGWCGTIDDGCGHTIDCGPCGGVGGGGGTGGAGGGGGGGSDAGVVKPSMDMAGCIPTVSCTTQVNCGTVDNGCGKALSCGDCATPNTCSAKAAHLCGCTPKSCAEVGATCGYYPDGCGHTLDCYEDGVSCGMGNSNGSCGGGGPYTCGKKGSCNRLTACPTNACGDIPDGCSNVLHCGGCPTGKVCGGGGRPNVCG